MTQSQEVLRNYKQLLSGNNTVQQTSFSSMVVGDTEIKGGNNKIAQQTKITRRRQKIISRVVGTYNITLSLLGNPIYIFNNTSSVYVDRQENNKFLTSSGGQYIIGYTTIEQDFIRNNGENLEDIISIEVLANSFEGTPAIKYNYSVTDLSIIFSSPPQLYSRKQYSYTQLPLFQENSTLLFDNLRDEPLNLPEDPLYSYMQDILTQLKAKVEYKCINVLPRLLVEGGCSYDLIDAENNSPITIPEPPVFASISTSLGTISNKHTDEFYSYLFNIGRTRQYIGEETLTNCFFLEAIDFSINTVIPDPLVLPLPFTASNDGLVIDLRSLYFNFTFFDIEEDISIPLEDLDSNISIEITGHIFASTIKNPANYQEVKTFSFSFNNGEMQGDYIFGGSMLFESIYLSYYVVIDSFDVTL
jgi:hypothetical protein